MKRLFTLIVMMLVTSFIMAQTPVKKVAVMETKAAEGVSEFQTNMIRGAMETAIANAKGYEGFDRTAFDIIMQEQNFQHSGAVDETQIKELGKMAGVQYVLVTEAAKEDGYLYIIAKLLDVETGKYGNAYDVLCQTSPTEIKESCAELGANLFGSGTTSRKKEINMIPSEQVAEVSVVKTEVSSNEVQMPQPHYITKIRKSYYLDGRRLSNSRYMELINNCYEANAAYNRGKSVRRIGWIALGSGIALTAIGVITGAGSTTDSESSYSYYDDPYYANRGYTYTESETTINWLAVVGVTVTIASVPVLIVGKKMKNNAYKDYNDYCAKSSANLSLNVKNNGLGICLNF